MFSYLAQLYDALFQTVCHVVNQAVQESFEDGRTHLLSHLFFESLNCPEPLKHYCAVMSVLELCEEHRGTSKFYINVECQQSFHKEISDDLILGKERKKFLFLVRLLEDSQQIDSFSLNIRIGNHLAVSLKNSYAKLCHIYYRLIFESLVIDRVEPYDLSHDINHIL